MHAGTRESLHATLRLAEILFARAGSYWLTHPYDDEADAAYDVADADLKRARARAGSRTMTLRDTPYPFVDGSRVQSRYFGTAGPTHGVIIDVGDGDWDGDVIVQWDDEKRRRYERSTDLEPEG